MSEHILIAFGGVSPEHEVSVISAIQAASALMEKGQTQLQALYIAKDGRWYMGEPLLDLKTYEQTISVDREGVEACAFGHDEYGRVVLKQLKKPSLFGKALQFTPDVVLLAFHGAEGENGSFQGVCEQYNLPYTGSDVLASSLGMHKAKAKQLAKAAGVPVVEGFTFEESDWVEKREEIISQLEKLAYPFIIKPLQLGSSIGVQRVTSSKELNIAVEEAFQYDRVLLAEKMVRPLVEINCSVWVNKGDIKLSPCEQPKGSDEVLSFMDKYLSDESTKGMASADRIIPAPIPDALRDQIYAYSETIARVLGISGVARIDFLLNGETQQVYFNEINTIPGSFSFYLWKEAGVSFSELLMGMLEDAKYRHQQKNGRVRQYDTNLLSKRAAKGLKGLKGNNGKS